MSKITYCIPYVHNLTNTHTGATAGVARTPVNWIYANTSNTGTTTAGLTGEVNLFSRSDDDQNYFYTIREGLIENNIDVSFLQNQTLRHGLKTNEPVYLYGFNATKIVVEMHPELNKYYSLRHLLIHQDATIPQDTTNFQMEYTERLFPHAVEDNRYIFNINQVLKVHSWTGNTGYTAAAGSTPPVGAYNISWWGSAGDTGPTGAGATAAANRALAMHNLNRTFQFGIEYNYKIDSIITSGINDTYDVPFNPNEAVLFNVFIEGYYVSNLSIPSVILTTAGILNLREYKKKVFVYDSTGTGVNAIGGIGQLLADFNIKTINRYAFKNNIQQNLTHVLTYEFGYGEIFNATLVTPSTANTENIKYPKLTFTGGRLVLHRVVETSPATTIVSWRMDLTEDSKRIVGRNIDYIIIRPPTSGNLATYDYDE